MNLLSLMIPVACASSPPAPPTPPSSPTPEASSGSTATNAQWIYKSAEGDVEIHSTGNVTFDVSSEAIFDLHGDGTLSIRTKNGNDVKTLTANAREVRFTVNGTAAPLNADGKAWLRKLLAARPATPTPPAPPAR